MYATFLCTILLAVAPATTQPAVEALIARLGSDDWQQREAAQAQLEQLGREARPALERAARRSADPEVRSRAETALARIDENAGIGPSLITIRGQGLSAAHLARLLSDQAGAPFELFPPDPSQHRQTFTVDIDRRPFWEAMQLLAEQTGYSFQNWDNSGPKLVQHGAAPPGEGINVTSGAFQITATRVMHTRAIDLAAGQPPRGQQVAEDFYLQLTARAEPKLRLLRVEYVPRIEQVEDENGRSLLTETLVDHGGGFAHAPAGMWQMTVRLQPVPEMGRRIAVLRGAVAVSVQTQSEQVEIADITSARGVSRVAGGVRFLVKELRKQGENWAVDVTASVEGAPAENWERLQQIMSMSDLRLIDDRGESFPRTGFSSSGNGQQTQITVEFSPGAWGREPNRIGAVPKRSEPSKLVWTVPTATREIDVPFEFIDLPIP